MNAVGQTGLPTGVRLSGRLGPEERLYRWHRHQVVDVAERQLPRFRSGFGPVFEQAVGVGGAREKGDAVGRA